MKRSHWISGGLVASAGLVALAGWVLANELTPRSVGLPIGARAPDFALLDQHGRSTSLSSLLGRGKLAIVFFRSADW